MVVYLDKTLAQWLERKTLEGYKKATLVRRALHLYRDSELEAERSVRLLKGGENGPNYADNGRAE